MTVIHQHPVVTQKITSMTHMMTEEKVVVRVMMMRPEKENKRKRRKRKKGKKRRNLRVLKLW